MKSETLPVKTAKIILTMLLYILIAEEQTISQWTNFQVFPTAFNQIEPTISRHQQNQQILFVSAYTINLNQRSEGTYFSTNGGLNWFGNDVCSGTPTQNHGGDPGTIIDKDGVFILTHLGNIQSGMFANVTTNYGTNWSANVSIQSNVDVDKGSPGTDDAPASSFYGRSYLAWTYFVSPFRIVMSYTTNNGYNWSPILNVNNGFGGNRSYGPAISVNPAGTLFITWASSIPNSPFTEDYIGISRSTNGGTSFDINENAIDINGIRTSQLTPWTIRANSFPVIDIDKTGGSRNGWIYIATTSKNLAPAGTDPDIVMFRSTDNGSTWSSGVRVNQDPINNGRNQFFPAVRVDENGGLNIIYYDSRNSADSVDVYLSRSDNGGNSFTDYRVTTQRFRPRAVSGAGGGNMGDNLGLTSGNGKLHPVWMSNQGDDVFRIWSAIIDYTTIGIEQISTEVPKNFSLEQNYPNPFNPETQINFSVLRSGFTTLKIYNSAGMLVKVLAEQDMKPGKYSAKWNAANEPSGVYFYTLETQGFKESKKMILVK
ncbi:MAG TPA: T9SS type A sorting domain-containing protein [Ignavibacteria bacterium]|nr:hypothetical protein [Bacteroidota bacterium]HRE11269.1 T9SS type A sorting domain-containing protein [Ignavibacteria bacterium]HRF67272.1 T9SS type A sorting domain-containing protein [Ignavibacteria bacterium]HRJ05127.1 T9SS type A sorting domain-containing protein [Ignavibacteria bacterium]